MSRQRRFGIIQMALVAVLGINVIAGYVSRGDLSLPRLFGHSVLALLTLGLLRDVRREAAGWREADSALSERAHLNSATDSTIPPMMIASTLVHVRPVEESETSFQVLEFSGEGEPREWFELDDEDDDLNRGFALRV